MSYLFGRRNLPGSYIKDENLVDYQEIPSIVILPPLHDDAKRVLEEQDHEILRIFTTYECTYGVKHGEELSPDTCIPLTNKDISGISRNPNENEGTLYAFLKETTTQVIFRSLFVPSSGHNDHVENVSDLMLSTCSCR